MSESSNSDRTVTQGAAPGATEGAAPGATQGAAPGVTEGTAASSEVEIAFAATEAQSCVPLAVFDFDGTSISGNSPVLLVFYLMRRKMLSKSVLARIAVWAIAYKFRLPQNESWVRGLVFSAFEGCSRAEVDAFLTEFYDIEIAHLFRKQADAVMQTRAQEGCKVIVVSATFEPIVVRAMENHPFDMQISTRMRTTEQDTYTREVEGLPVEGAEKVAALTRFADKHFGQDGWRLAYAYGDHHSDEELLSAAEHAFAVTPDKPLSRLARRNGWEILSWN